MPTIETDFTAECGKCGANLEATVGLDHEGCYVVTVEPCDKCIDDAYNEGKGE